jgi:hypothetical protein
MWNDSFVLADRIKGVLALWVGMLIAAATVADVMGVAEVAILPLSILGIVAQTFIVVAALRVVGGNGAAGDAIGFRFGTVLGIALLSGLGILLGGLLLVLPGLFLLIRWWIAVPVALDRNVGVGEALRESWELTADHWAKIAGLFLGLLVLFAVPALLLGFFNGIDAEPMDVGTSLLLNIVTYGVTNFGTVSTVAVYRAINGQQEDLHTVFE